LSIINQLSLSYYAIALLGNPLDPLTYSSTMQLPAGNKVGVTLSGRLCEGVILSCREQPSFATEPIVEILPFIYDDFQRQSAHFMATYYGCSIGEALTLFVPFPIIPCDDTKSLVLNHLGEDEVSPHCLKIPITITLSPTQNEALNFLRSHPLALLFGDTGAGKSEIYMKRMEDILRSGKQAVLLLPEIALTPQMESRFNAHFGEAFVLWHSKMTPKQKTLTLEKIHTGSARIVAGPRSALFLPIQDLGLIIVDEEHDESYKSSSRPRYHARDMAIYMGKNLSIPVILGSATPSLTSYAKIPFFRLRGGYYPAHRTFVFEPSIETLSPLINEAVKNNFNAGHQGIVFIPTRANFKTMVCDGCGKTLECPFCSVGMSLHKNARALKCHYCNYVEMIPLVCPKCHSGHLSSLRLGTAEAVEHFETTFPEIKVQQFDRDVITTQTKLIKILKSFNHREIDLLVGTQMLSKGHDYHDIALAVVMGMDHILGQADYRAREKALSLLLQIAGRSGRKNDSTVIVQSFNESFFRPYLDDYERFLREELSHRQGHYPPYTKLARLLFAHKNGTKARLAMDKAVEQLKQISTVEIVGHGASPIEKIADKYRFQILLRSFKSTDLIRAIKSVKSPLMEIDMDPIEFT
jgi:primosomal protein N' (replication factor Y)